MNRSEPRLLPAIGKVKITNTLFISVSEKIQVRTPMNSMDVDETENAIVESRENSVEAWETSLGRCFFIDCNNRQSSFEPELTRFVIISFIEQL